MRNGLSGRITEIEGIRGILSLIVVAGHMIASAGSPLFWFWGCMDIFFCISGFVITRILLENLARPGFLKNYFIRRVLRIWPMYYVALAFAYLVYGVTAGSTFIRYGVSAEWQPTWYEILMPLAYLQNTEMYFGFDRFNYQFLLGHTWSVAVEEHFYLLWPLVLLFVLRGVSVPTRLFLAAAGICLSMLLRLEKGGWETWLLLLRLDGFIFGAVLAFLEAALARGRPLAQFVAPRFRWLWIWPLLALLPYLSNGYLGWQWNIPRVLHKTVFDPFFNFSLLAFCWVGYCVFIAPLHAGRAPMSRLLNLRPLQHLGTISYSTYLLHAPVAFAVSPYLISVYDLPPVFSVIITFGLSIGLAHFTFKWVEATAMRLKRRFAYADEKKGDATCTTPYSDPASSPVRPSSLPVPAPASAAVPRMS